MMKRRGTLINKKYNEYLISTIAMSASLYLAAIVDNIMVANIIGAEALAAVNLTLPIVCIKNIIFSIFIYGGNTLAAIYKGKRDNENSDKAFTFSVIFGILASGIVVFFGVVFAGPTARFLSQDGNLYQLTLDYIVPNWLCGPLVVLNSGVAAYVRTDGMKNLAVALPIISNVINLICDYIFMAVFHMGVAGAGWATVVGYALGSLLLLLYRKSPKRTFHFIKVNWKDMKILFDVLYTGLASALIHVCNVIRTAVINGVILKTAGSAGMQVVAVAMSALNLALIFINGSSMTIMPVCGALYGENDRNGLKYIIKHALILTEIISIIIFIIYLFIPQQIGMLFAVKSPEAAAMLNNAFRIFSLCIPFYGLSYLLRAFYQSTRQKSAASLFTILEGVVFIVPLIYIFAAINENIMWLSFAISEIFALAVTIVIMQARAKKQNKENFLMIEKSKEDFFLDMTINNTIENAEEISSKIFSFCNENGVSRQIANMMSVSAEELTVNIVKYAYKNKEEAIDICLRKLDDKLVMRIRDNGIMFNPIDFIDDSGQEITGLILVKKLTPDITYNRILSFNVTVVSVPLK